MPKTSKFINPFKGNKAEIFSACYYAILHAENKLISKAIYRNIDLEETCDVPQSIKNIDINNNSIFNTLTINKKLCTDINKA